MVFSNLFIPLRLGVLSVSHNAVISVQNTWMRGLVKLHHNFHLLMDTIIKFSAKEANKI